MAAFDSQTQRREDAIHALLHFRFHGNGEHRVVCLLLTPMQFLSHLPGFH